MAHLFAVGASETVAVSERTTSGVAGVRRKLCLSSNVNRLGAVAGAHSSSVA